MSKKPYSVDLVAPEEFKQRFTKYTDPEVRKAFDEWILQKAKEGYTGSAIARATNRKQTNISKKLRDMGYNWFDQPRLFQK